MSDDTTVPELKTWLSNKVYDALKWIALIALPALGTAYFAFGGIWHIPMTEEVVGSLTILDALLGVLLGVSSSQAKKSGALYDGKVTEVPSSDPNAGAYKFSIDLTADQIAAKKEIVLQVAPPSQ